LRRNFHSGRAKRKKNHRVSTCSGPERICVRQIGT